MNHVNKFCKCTSSGVDISGTAYTELGIKFCSLHAAAPTAYELIRKIIEQVTLPDDLAVKVAKYLNDVEESDQKKEE